MDGHRNTFNTFSTATCDSAPTSSKRKVLLRPRMHTRTLAITCSQLTRTLRRERSRVCVQPPTDGGKWAAG